MNDRRKDQRYQLGNSCIINYQDQVGTIVDIGKGGLSCICLESNYGCTHKNIKHVDIFCIKKNLLAQGLKVKTLASEIILGKYIETIKTRKCRIQFIQLGDEQIALLENIIISHAVQ